MSGSCSLRTCWKATSPFRDVGAKILARYERAKQVVPYGDDAIRPTYIKLKRSKRDNKKPKQNDLVFLKPSPSFCDYDEAYSSLGTTGRRCTINKTGHESCDEMCCGRGYNTRAQTTVMKCKCKFHYCCTVTCDTCLEQTFIHTCK